MAKTHTYQPLVILYNNENYEDIINEFESSSYLGDTPKPAIVILDYKDGHVINGRNILKITSSSISDYDYVDLGLPSGTLWASCNLGASKPYEFGNYYQWGSVYGFSNESDILEHNAWETSPFNGGNETFDKENYTFYKEYGYPNYTLSSTYDAAVYASSGNSRIPTMEEVAEMIDETTSNGKNCWCVYQVSSSNLILGRYIEGSTGNAIFLPAAGYYNNGTRLTGRCLYWTSECYKDYKTYQFYDEDGNTSTIKKTDYSNAKKAHCMSFKHDNFYMDNFYKCFSMPVRGIASDFEF